jgi:hypothetical protein
MFVHLWGKKQKGRFVIKSHHSRSERWGKKQLVQFKIVRKL